MRTACGCAAAAAAFAAAGAAPAAGAVVPKAERYIGETRPGTGIVNVTVRNRRITDIDIQHRFWRCTGADRGAREMGWDLRTFGPRNAVIVPKRDGTFRLRYAVSGGGTFSRFTVAGRFLNRGGRITGTFTWARRGIRRDGPVECRTNGPIRFSAHVAERDYSGTSSQGVPTHLRVSWIADMMAWIRRRPPYIQGGLARVTGDVRSTTSSVLLTCEGGGTETERFGGKVDPRDGTLRINPGGAGGGVTLTGRASPLASVAPGRISLTMTVARTNPPCSGSASFAATELVPLT